jgi:hypothetical protein
MLHHHKALHIAIHEEPVTLMAKEVIKFVSSNIINVLQGIHENLFAKVASDKLLEENLSDRAIFSTWSFFALSEHWQDIKSPSVPHLNAFFFSICSRRGRPLT